MKNWVISILIFVFISVLMYSAVYFWIIPTSAKLLMPFAWNHIPLDQKRIVSKSYLGTSLTDKNWRTKGDTWIIKRDKYEYILNIAYSKDSIATHYSIQYH